MVLIWQFGTTAEAVLLVARLKWQYFLLQVYALPSWNCFSHDSCSHDCHSSAGRWPSQYFGLVYAGKVLNSLYSGTVRQGRRMCRGKCCDRMVKIVWEIIVVAFSLLSLVRNTFICHGYIIGGSETGSISQDTLSWDRFSINTMLKLGGWFQTL